MFYAKLAGHSVTLMPSSVKWYEETFVKLSDSDRQEMWRQIVTGGPISGSLGKRLG